MPFRVRATSCATCIYRKDSPLDLEALEKEVRDAHGGFDRYRICHHSETLCCRGFWNRHRDAFTIGQLAQRLGQVLMTDEEKAMEPQA